jgi:hypothetical protein
MSNRFLVSSLFLLAVVLGVWLFIQRAGPVAASGSPLESIPRDQAPSLDPTDEGRTARASLAHDPSTAPAPSDPIVVRVVDERGLVVPAAAISCVSAGADARHPLVLRFGATDASGTLAVERSRLTGSRLVATADGFSASEVALRPPLSATIELSLARAREIGGIVLDDSTSLPAPKGTRVVAWPAELRLAPVLGGHGALAGDPRTLSASTDEHGVFTIRGVPLDATRYCFVAGGPGLAMRRSTCVEMSDGVVVELHASKLYGVVTRLVDERGGALVIDAAMLSSHASRVSYREMAGFKGGVEPLDQPNYALELAGVPTDPEYDAVDEEQLLFTTREQVPELGPIQIHVDIAGYDPLDRAVWAKPVIDDIEVTTITLRRTRVPVGAVHVFFANAPQPMVEGTQRGGAGKIVLQSDAGPRLEYALRGLASGNQLLTQIPSGRYAIHLETYGALFRYPDYPLSASYVEVEEEGTATWVADLGACGSLELSLRTQSGGEHLGAVAFVLLAGDASLGATSSGMPVFFESAPYVLPLVSGAHDVLPGVLRRAEILYR